MGDRGCTLHLAMSNSETIYQRAGGAVVFERIVERFYEGVETDALLRPMYPADLTAGKGHLALFLMQYFGGPGTYSEGRGHPRLRMRHAPFSIGPNERDAWLRHMRAAVLAEKLSPEIENVLLTYFERAANFLMNR